MLLSRGSARVSERARLLIGPRHLPNATGRLSNQPEARVETFQVLLKSSPTRIKVRDRSVRLRQARAHRTPPARLGAQGRRDRMTDSGIAFEAELTPVVDGVFDQGPGVDRSLDDICKPDQRELAFFLIWEPEM